MTITLYGFGARLPTEPVGGLDETHWNRYQAIRGRGANDQVVDNGLVASAATGTRLIAVTTGNAVAAGVLAEVTGSTTNVTLDANASGNSRIDYIVLKIDWTGTSLTGGTLTFVKGTPAASPVPPALTKTEGTLWHIPLARVTVRNGIGQIAAGDVETCRPLARVSKEYSDVFGTGSVGFGNVDIQRSTINVADPGWSHRLLVSAYLDPSASSQGRAKVEVKVNGAVIGVGYTGDKNASPAVVAARSTDVLTGASTVTANLTPLSMTTNLGIQSGRLNVTLLPA